MPPTLLVADEVIESHREVHDWEDVGALSLLHHFYLTDDRATGEDHLQRACSLVGVRLGDEGEAGLSQLLHLQPVYSLL